jgi:hypothetical protein
MLIAYVSDEMDFAIGGASLEVVGPKAVELRSGPSGAIHGELDPGDHDVILSKPGFGRKRLRIAVSDGEIPRLRLISGRPYGYVWPKWVAAGESGELRIHAGRRYHTSVWRYGWHREQVADLGWFDDHPKGSIRQLLPDTDVARDGVGWNHHGYLFPSFDPRVVVVAPDRSALYYVHVEDEVGRFFSFPWIVVPRIPTAPVAVLASNITWNAYNDFGGRSNYVVPDRLPEAPSVNSRQEEVWFSDPELPPWDAAEYEPLSFDRPEPLNSTLRDEAITDPIINRGAEHVAPAEWRMLGWMEREGHGYDLYAETQLDAGLVDLDAYRVLILSTHPEYWTRRMYERVKSWVVDRGGKLMYLGGNGINCEVDLHDDHRMTVRNGRHRDRGADFESRFGMRGECEAALLGVVTTMTGYETGAPYRVLAPDHWAFEGLGLREGDLIGELSLDRRAIGGASGHETDKRTASTPPQARLLAKGTNPDEGGAEMLHIEFPSGGEVFSVGSISYTCSIAIDDGISRLTTNVLNRFLDGG